jgi:hypothetical protein
MRVTWHGYDLLKYTLHMLILHDILHIDAGIYSNYNNEKRLIIQAKYLNIFTGMNFACI